MKKQRNWTKRISKREPIKITSTDKGAETVHYITMEEWFENIEDIGKCIILPGVKDFCIRA